MKLSFSFISSKICHNELHISAQYGCYNMYSIVLSPQLNNEVFEYQIATIADYEDFIGHQYIEKCELKFTNPLMWLRMQGV